jgi:hypothetical protein
MVKCSGLVQLEKKIPRAIEDGRRSMVPSVCFQEALMEGV